MSLTKKTGSGIGYAAVALGSPGMANNLLVGKNFSFQPEMR
jgi:hypothetical protein